MSNVFHYICESYYILILLSFKAPNNVQFINVVTLLFMCLDRILHHQCQSWHRPYIVWAIFITSDIWYLLGIKELTAGCWVVEGHLEHITCFPCRHPLPRSCEAPRGLVTALWANAHHPPLCPLNGLYTSCHLSAHLELELVSLNQ